MVIHLKKDIPDADSKKIIQHHFKLKRTTGIENTRAICGMREKETFDVIINVRSYTMSRQGHSLSCESCKIVYGKKSCLCVGICGLFTLWG